LEDDRYRAAAGARQPWQDFLVAALAFRQSLRIGIHDEDDGISTLDQELPARREHLLTGHRDDLTAHHVALYGAAAIDGPIEVRGSTILFVG
jgi:hypothetical protein